MLALIKYFWRCSQHQQQKADELIMYILILAINYARAIWRNFDKSWVSTRKINVGRKVHGTAKEHIIPKASGQGFDKVRRTGEVVVPKLWVDFSSRWGWQKKNVRSPKDERVTGAKDGSFEAIAASLSGRALNFPRLNRSTLDGDSGDGVVFLLTFDCTRSRKGAHVSSFTPYIYTTVIAGSSSRKPRLPLL